jgi:Arc/MetJ-type ribon-helix-helix transcriptional regulator
MTRRITVSLPDDVADYLASFSNASAVVTEAVRAYMNRGAAITAALRAAGVPLTDEGIAAARGTLPAFTEAQRAEIRAWHEAKAAERAEANR